MLFEVALYIPSAFDAFVYAYDRLPASEPTFDKVVGQGMDVGGMQLLHARHDYSRSILCTDVWRPYGIGCLLDLVLREGGTPRGMVCINREPQHSRFTAPEYCALRGLAPHFSMPCRHPRPMPRAPTIPRSDRARSWPTRRARSCRPAAMRCR